MPRFIPPAGAPLSLAEILDSVRSAIFSNGHAADCLPEVAGRFQVNYVSGASSGRAALWLILRSLHRLRPERTVVAVPAYTCFSVPAAIARAGLKIFPMDVDASTLEPEVSDLVGVPDGRLLCVIGCNLFGFPNDMSALCKAAKSKGAYVIDDAAQALGATREGRFAGTFGDVGFYSLGRGKAVGSLEGGLVITSSPEIAGAIQGQEANLVATSVTHGTWLFCEMLAYSLLLKPNLFWIPNSMPFLKLGVTEFNPSFRAAKIHPLSMALLRELLKGLEDVNETRRANARVLMEMMEGSPDIEVPKPAVTSRPTFVRLPLLGRDKQMRDRAVAALRNAGIGATAFYPSAICDIEGIEAYMATCNFHRDKAEKLSQRLFTVPVGPVVTFNDLERTAKILREL